MDKRVELRQIKSFVPGVNGYSSSFGQNYMVMIPFPLHNEEVVCLCSKPKSLKTSINMTQGSNDVYDSKQSSAAQLLLQTNDAILTREIGKNV